MNNDAGSKIQHHQVTELSSPLHFPAPHFFFFPHPSVNTHPSKQESTQLSTQNKRNKTLNLDALAAGGVVFDSAYCPSPLCAPSRMSMVSGQLPTKIGSYDNACSIDPSVPTYAHYLRAAGYETTLAGKMHFIGEQLHGYESRLTSDIYPGDYGWAVNWEEPNRRLEWYHNASSIEQAGPCVRSNQLDYDEEVMYK